MATNSQRIKKNPPTDSTSDSPSAHQPSMACCRISSSHSIDRPENDAGNNMKTLFNRFAATAGKRAARSNQLYVAGGKRDATGNS